MNIAIIGAGNVGSALGKRWAKAGHQVALDSSRLGTGLAHGIRAPSCSALSAIRAATDSKTLQDTVFN